MSTDRPELTGARLSSAMRCVARAEHEALGSPRDPYAQTLLEDAFVRGVNVAKAWVRDQADLTAATGKTLTQEKPVAWGPREYGWEGHADAVIEEDKLVIEAYHAKDGTFRRNKALQAAAYASLLGPDYRAMLAVLDSTDIDEDEGFAVTLIPLDVDELAEETSGILTRVIDAVAAGKWNPEDRVAATPADNECRHCPFRETCWEGWQPPTPIEMPELDELVGEFVRLRAEKKALEASVDQVDAELVDARQALRAYVPIGTPLHAAGVAVKRLEIRPRRTFSFAAYEGAGHFVSPTMREFVKEGEATDRFYVGKLP